MTLAGKTILITGASDGLGRALADRIAGPGVTLILHGRDETRSEAVRAEAAAKGAAASFFRADFARLADVGALAAAIAATHARLDVLINNAGIGFGRPGDGRHTSADGHELRFQVNYLAHVLLTERLKPLLIASAPSRVINVASIGQRRLDFDDLMLTRSYEGSRAYRQAKLAMIMWTIDLAAELKSADVRVNALHPATFMDTRMVREAGGAPMNTVATGVDATMNLVLDDTGITGAFFNVQRLAEPDPQAADPEARRKLRDATRALLGL